ncbi:MAG TPA: hypothetical protein VKY65_00935 [Alphaproteobacteria bacterium]|nr:hypothetical protein [Alphaproteobacteria bacterium]
MGDETIKARRRSRCGLGVIGLALLALTGCAATDPAAAPLALPGYHLAGMPYGRLSDGALPLRDFEIRQLLSQRAAAAPPSAAAEPPAPVPPPASAPPAAAANTTSQLAALPPAAPAPTAPPATESAAAAGAAGPSLAQLKGLTAGELKRVLGTPTLLRRDGPAQLWQYAGTGCVLHVYLYDDGGTFRVAYSEVRVDDAEIANPPACVAAKAWTRHPAAPVSAQTSP